MTDEEYEWGQRPASLKIENDFRIEMQGEGHPTYSHHLPMDLHVPQHFPYYAG